MNSRYFITGCLLWTISKVGLLGALADQGDEFLQSIMSKLQEEKPKADDYNLFHDQIFASSQRSILAGENEIENQDHNIRQSLYNFNQQLQNLNFPQFGQNWGEFLNQPAPLSVPYDLNGQSLAAQRPTQQYNVHDPFATFDSASANANHGQSLGIAGPTTENINAFQNLNPLSNTGPNLFSQNDLSGQIQPFQGLSLQGAQNNAGTIPAIVNTNGLQYNGEQNNQLGSMFYLLNPTVDNANLVDDNLIDNTLNAMKPHGAEDLSLIENNNALTKFPVEPLFVAMAGFVGIAVIFMSCVLFLPKIFTSPPTISNLKGPQELAAFTKLAVKAVEGQDCIERIACEVGRAMRNFHVEGKPIKVLEVMLPANLAQQLAQIRKAIADKRNCRLIQCKPNKGANNKMKTIPEKKEVKTEEQATVKIIELINLKNTNKPQAKKHQDKEKEKTLLEPRINVLKNETLPVKKMKPMVVELQKIFPTHEGIEKKKNTTQPIQKEKVVV